MSTTTSPPRRTAGARAATLVAATAVAVAAWLIAHSVLGIHPKTGSSEVSLYDVATATPVISLIAWFVLSGIDRRASNPRKIWMITAFVVLVLSLIGPVTGAGTSSKLVLAGLHLVVALVLIPGYARTLKTSQEA